MLIIVSSFGIAVSADDTTGNSKLLIDVDFENFTDKTGNAVLTVKGNVEKGSFTGFDGSNVPYAQFDSNEENWISVDPDKNADENGGNKFLNKAETTVEMWIKADSLANRYSHFLLIKRHSGELLRHSSVGIELTADGKMYPIISKKMLTTGFIDAPLGWNHFVLTRSYDADTKTVTAKIYINGKLNTEGTVENISAPDASDAKIFFGGTNEDRINDFIGKIAKARIYESVMAADEVTAAYEADKNIFFEEEITDEPGIVEDNLVFDLDFSKWNDEGTLSDKTGNVKAFDVTGTPTVNSGINYNNESFSYMSFGDGKTKNVVISNGSEISKLFGNNETTVDLWLKTEDFKPEARWEKIITNFDGPKNIKRWMLEFGTNGSKEYYLANCTQNESKANNVILNNGAFDIDGLLVNKWANITLTRKHDPDTGTLTYKTYINGEKQGSDIVYASQSGINAGTSLYIGAYGGASESFRGDISVVRIYDTAFSDEAVKERYETSAEKYSTPYFTFENQNISTDSSKALINASSETNIADMISKGFDITSIRTKDGIEFVPAEEEGKISLSFSQYFDFGERLKVYSHLLGAFNYLNFEKGDTKAVYTVKNANGEAIEVLDGSDSYTVEISAENTGDSVKTYKYAVIARDSKNSAVSKNSEYIFENVEPNTNKSATVSLSNTKNAETLFICVWEIDGERLVPVCDMPVWLK